MKNHYSADAYANAVNKFLNKKHILGVMIGPLQKLPFDCCHVSPDDPVNIRNIFKWFKRLQNILKT